MDKLYIITGANGHLGNTIIRLLKKCNHKVRGLLLPSENQRDNGNITYVKGDVRDKESLFSLFADSKEMETIVIHTAGIVDISGEVTENMYNVNVNGTKNIIDLCLENKVKRLIYVSSVHAIPEKSKINVLNEVDSFSAEEVNGGYAKTKAEATKLVLDSIKNGLDAVVVHPSGILGPYDSSGNHLVQMVSDYVRGRLPACVNGGYDFVDVRDVAYGCLAAVEKGKKGNCYILSNRHYEVKEILNMVRTVQGGRRLPVLPLWMAKAAAPLLGAYAKLKKERPLYTKYSLYTLNSNDKFSHDKATAELNYHPRDLYETIRDTVLWIKRKGIKA